MHLPNNCFTFLSFPSPSLFHQLSKVLDDTVKHLLIKDSLWYNQIHVNESYNLLESFILQ